MRAACVIAVIGFIALSASASTQQGSEPAYLQWTADDARRIGKSMRVNGRVGGAFDLRVVHTERSYNYKLRATWLTRDVIRATARLRQLAERLTDTQTEQLVQEGLAAGDVVMMVEIDPREGSGVIPTDWSAFLGREGNDLDAVKGVSRPSLEKALALRGVYPRDYNYDVFWVVFPLAGSNLFATDVKQVTLSVRISGKEGRVVFSVPQEYRR